jgi:hypothetical protein
MQQTRVSVWGTTRASVLMPTMWAGEALVAGLAGVGDCCLGSGPGGRP